MKKTTKLSLHRETIRRLGDADTRTVAGGITFGPCATKFGPACASMHPVSCTGESNPTVIWC